MPEGIVFNIMKYAIHDGPGIRTTVFLKGCPLACAWCHNPESQGFAPQISFLENRCMGWGDCMKSCPEKAISLRDNRLHTDPTLCRHCGACAKLCPTTAREMTGIPMTVAALLKELEKDRVFYEQSGGGVTFSGGEPFAQPAFLEEALQACKHAGLHTAVDTSGYVRTDILLKLNPLIDLYLYDLKLLEDDKHLQYTGVSNQLILKNLRALNDAEGKLWLRLPIIPGINDSDENIRGIGALLRPLQGVAQVNLLPYHHISGEKYRRLRMKYTLEDVAAPAPEDLEALAKKMGEYVDTVMW